MSVYDIILCISSGATMLVVSYLLDKVKFLEDRLGNMEFDDDGK